jgi:hypothetical protein
MTTSTVNAFTRPPTESIRAASFASLARIPEVAWLPFYTAGCGVLALGIVMRMMGPQAMVAVVALSIVGAVLVLAGWLRGQAKRYLVLRDGNEVQVLRRAAAGPSFEAAELRAVSHGPGLTFLYFVLALTVGNLSLKLFSASALSPSGFSRGELLGFGGGLLIEALFAVAAWRRAVCTRIQVPGENRSLWVRDDDVRQLGIRITRIPGT